MKEHNTYGDSQTCCSGVGENAMDYVKPQDIVGSMVAAGASKVALPIKDGGTVMVQMTDALR